MTPTGTLRFRLPITIPVAGGLGLVGATALATQRWWLAPLVLPFLLWVAYGLRAGTDVDADAVTARVLLGRRRIPWSDVEGFDRVARRPPGVAARTRGGTSVLLPAVRPADLSRLLAAAESRTA